MDVYVRMGRCRCMEAFTNWWMDESKLLTTKFNLMPRENHNFFPQGVICTLQSDQADAYLDQKG